MGRNLMLLCLLFLSQISWAKNLEKVEDKFFGYVAREVQLNFDTKIFLRTSHKFDLALLKQNERLQKWAKSKIDVQVQYLIGYFGSESFHAYFKTKATMDDIYKVKFLNVEETAKGVVLTYNYSSKSVFNKKVFGSSSELEVDVKLPLDPETIYDHGVVDGVNLCSDEHYNDESDFFYFWDTELPGCPLKGKHPAVVKSVARAKLLPQTDRTYPEYDKLYAAQNDAYIFIGYLDDEISTTHVNRMDSAYANTQKVSDWLEEMNFTKKVTLNGFSGDVTQRPDSFSKGANIYYRYEKEIQTQTGRNMKWNVHILLADTGPDSEDETFRDLYARALEQGSLIVYDGHSGLGANLDLSILPEFDFRKKDYQILYLNGCSSYPYFKTPYFRAKGGSKNLDIITSGLSTYDTSAFSNMRAFLYPFLAGKTPSYQTIMKYIETSNGDIDTYLTGVNGDEDNEWQPAQ